MYQTSFDLLTTNIPEVIPYERFRPADKTSIGVNLDKKKWRGPDHGERGARAHNGGLGRSPQRGPRAEPLVRGSVEQSPPEAESFLRIGQPKEGARSTLRH